MNLYGFVGNDTIRFHDMLGLDIHHWIPEKRKRGQKSRGQGVFNDKCEKCCPIDIQTLTQEIDGAKQVKNTGDPAWGLTPHGFLTFTLHWNTLHDKIYDESKDCCDYLKKLSIAIIATKTAMLALNKDGYFRKPTSYTDPNITSGLEMYILSCCKNKDGGDENPIEQEIREAVYSFKKNHSRQQAYEAEATYEDAVLEYDLLWSELYLDAAFELMPGRAGKLVKRRILKNIFPAKPAKIPTAGFPLPAPA